MEAHGTGTPLGDPIEVGASGKVFAREGRGRCCIGSVKTNVGHLEAAAGVAGLIKATLALHHGEIPASLHFEEPNPHVPWETIPVRVADHVEPFPGTAGARLAGVSSFGFTGTNVHVILGEAPERGVSLAAKEGDDTARLLKLSARTPAALDALVSAVSERLRGMADPDFGAFCAWMNRGRADLPERLALHAPNPAVMAERLTRFGTGDEVEEAVRRSGGREVEEVAMLFTGHGAQRPGMTTRLARAYPVVREALERCDALLAPMLGRSLLDALNAPEGSEAARALVEGMSLSQPALFAAEYALAELWRSWGVRPTLVLGHSVGEYVAATVAGLIDLEDGLRLVTARGRLMDSLPDRGAMAAVFATEDQVREVVSGMTGVEIAAVNGPTETVISGGRGPVDEAANSLELRGWEVRRLAVSQAAHSALLDPILDDFEEVVRGVRFRDLELALVSCTSGRLVDPSEVATPGYWRRHLREPVRFHDAVRSAVDEGYRLFVEAGPHPVLSGLGRRAMPDQAISWVPSLRSGRPEGEQMLESLAAYWCAGGPLDWDAIGAGGDPTPRAPSSGPTYPWEHREYRRADGPVQDSLPFGTAERRWARSVAAGRREEQRGPLDFRPEVFPARWAALDRLTVSVLGTTLTRASVLDRGGPATAEEIAQDLGVLPRYRSLLARWLRRLEDAGILRDTEGRYERVQDERIPDPDAVWAEAEAAMGQDGAFLVEYLRRCARALPDVLCGTSDPLETLFPGGSTETADLLYRDWAVVRYYNHVLRAVFTGLLESAGRPVRVLEVGAGTGGTTAALLPEADGRMAQYAFTDISPAFLEPAEQRFGRYPFMTFATLDLNADPSSQGFEKETFDVVIASNVLHATRSLPRALEAARSLLAPGGVLLAFEITRYLSWFDMSTSLLEGWESYEDEHRREHPLLSVEQWSRVLADAGFARFEAFPSTGPALDLGFHVLAAQVPGEMTDVHPSSEPANALDDASGPSPSERGPEMVGELASAPAWQREELLVEFVRNQIARMLRMGPEEKIGRRQRLMELGLDSLMAVELRSRLNGRLPLTEPLPSTLIFDFPTVEAIVSLVLTRLDLPSSAQDDPDGLTSEGSGEQSTLADEEEMASLSDEEAELRLLDRLESLEREG